MSEKRILILDTSAFIAGFNSLSIVYEQYSVPMVEQELVPRSLSWIRFKTAINSGKLRLRTPSNRSYNKVKELSKRVGDVLFLSEVDLQVLALALEKKEAGFNPTIVTDDYSIQNLSEQIKTNFTSLTTFGIRYRLHWIIYCPACNKKYPPDYQFQICEICGTNLKRKPLDRMEINKQ